MFRRRSGHPVWIHLSLALPAHNAGLPETFVLAPSCAFTQYVTLRYWALSVLILPLVRDTKFRMCFWGLQLSQVQSLSSNLKGSVELQISSATNANFCQLDLKCTAVVSVTSVHVANASGYTRQLYINQDDFTGYYTLIEHQQHRGTYRMVVYDGNSAVVHVLQFVAAQGLAQRRFVEALIKHG